MWETGIDSNLLGEARGTQSPPTVRGRLLASLELLLDFHPLGLVALGDRFQVQGFLPQFDRFGFLLQSHLHLGIVVQDFGRLLAFFLFHRFFESFLGLFEFTLLEKDPTQAVEVRGIVLVVAALEFQLFPDGALQVKRLADEFLGLIEVLVVVKLH